MSDDTDLLNAINVDEFPDGQAVSFELIFGKSLTYEDGRIVAAEAMSQVRVRLNPEGGTVVGNCGA